MDSRFNIFLLLIILISDAVCRSYAHRSPGSSIFSGRGRRGDAFRRQSGEHLANDDDIVTIQNSANSFSKWMEKYTSEPEPPRSWTDKLRTKPQRPQTLTTPVIYKHFQRSRSRHNAETIPFIIFGPNADHWVQVGEALSSRGFDVVVCERITDADDDKEKDEDVVLSVMEAFNMERAVLIACDDEASFVIESTVRLAPDRIAALVICGDLQNTNRLAKEAGFASVDLLLEGVIDCPFNIVWDGRTASSAKKSHELESNRRTVILGGSTAPQRLRPEHLVWVLSRFVEENIFASERSNQSERSSQRQRYGERDEQRSNYWPKISFAPRIPFSSSTFISPEGRLVIGRVVASVFFYVTVIKVTLVQYSILKSWFHSIKDKYSTVDALRKRVSQAVVAFVVGIPRIFRLSVKRAEEEDDHDLGIDEIDLLAPESPLMDDEPYKQAPGSLQSERFDAMSEEEETEEEDEYNIDEYQDNGKGNTGKEKTVHMPLLDHVVA